MKAGRVLPQCSEEVWQILSVAGCVSKGRYALIGQCCSEVHDLVLSAPTCRTRSDAGTPFPDMVFNMSACTMKLVRGSAEQGGLYRRPGSETRSKRLAHGQNGQWKMTPQSFTSAADQSVQGGGFER